MLEKMKARITGLLTDKKTRNALIVPGAVLLLLILMSAFYMEHWMESDFAAEMIFSKLMSETGHYIATPDWYYSTEYRLFYTQLIMVPLFKFMKSWTAIRVITNIVFYGILLASYAFMVKPLKAKTERKILFAALLLVPFSETMAQHMQFGNTYIAHVILMFWNIGLVLRLAFEQDRLKLQDRETLAAGSGWQIWYLCALTVLAMVCGASGVRYFLSVYAPLLVAGLWLIFRGEHFRALLDADERPTFRGLIRDLRDVYMSREAGIFRNSLGASAIAFIGYLFNVTYIRSHFIFTTYEDLNFIRVINGELFRRIENSIGSFLELMGYIPDRGVLSLRGFITLLSFVMIVVGVVVIVSVHRQLRNPFVPDYDEDIEYVDLEDAGAARTEAETSALFEEDAAYEDDSESMDPSDGVAAEADVVEDVISGKEPGYDEDIEYVDFGGPVAVADVDDTNLIDRFFLALFHSAFIIMTFVLVFTYTTITPRYYLMPLVLILPLLLIYDRREVKPFRKDLVLWILTLSMTIAGAKILYSMATVDKNADRSAAAAYLTENGYTFGYAMYDDANMLEELTDGALEAAGIRLEDGAVKYFRWSSPAAYYEPGYATGPVFLLLTTEDYAANSDASAVAAGTIVYDQDGYVILAYDSPEALREE
jgi:hypothetical protein